MVFFEILCYFLPLNPGIKCFIKPNCMTLFIFLEEVDHSQTKGGKVTLNLYIDRYTVTKGLSEYSFELKGPQTGVLTG